MKPLIAIVGRPNVGKSTLFNRIVGHRAAIVQDQPGVTRDRHYAEAEWTGRRFDVVDTGGFEPDDENILKAGMRRQAQLAVEEAQATVLVVDAMAGLSAADEDVALYLRRSGARVVVAANKVDSLVQAQERAVMSEIYALGFETVAVSAEHGKNVGDLLDAVLEGLDAPKWDLGDEPTEGTCRVAVIGRPNVGKSTLINALLGEDRMLATEIPGTTRDSVDSDLNYQGTRFVLTDTAGIRRKKTISMEVERYSVVRAIRSIERSDVVVLVVDSEEVGVGQEARLARLSVDRGRPVVVALNKWDLLKDGPKADMRLREEFAEKLPAIAHAPIILTSALEKKRVYTLLEEVAKTWEWSKTRISTADLNRWLEDVTALQPPPHHKHRPVRLRYVSQVDVHPPVFRFSCNRPEGLTDAYKRFLMNQLREAFGFPGVTFIMKFG